MPTDRSSEDSTKSWSEIVHIYVQIWAPPLVTNHTLGNYNCVWLVVNQSADHHAKHQNCQIFVIGCWSPFWTFFDALGNLLSIFNWTLRSIEWLNLISTNVIDRQSFLQTIFQTNNWDKYKFWQATTFCRELWFEWFLIR